MILTLLTALALASPVLGAIGFITWDRRVEQRRKARMGLIVEASVLGLYVSPGESAESIQRRIQRAREEGWE